MKKNILKVIGIWLIGLSIGLISVKDYKSLDSIWNQSGKMLYTLVATIINWATKSIAPVVQKHPAMLVTSLVIAIAIIGIWELYQKSR